MSKSTASIYLNLLFFLQIFSSCNDSSLNSNSTQNEKITPQESATPGKPEFKDNTALPKNNEESNDVKNTTESPTTPSACGIKEEHKTYTVAGKNLGFYVDFVNKSDKAIDAIQYEVTFLNAFDETVKTMNQEWHSDDLDDP